MVKKLFLIIIFLTLFIIVSISFKINTSTEKLKIIQMPINFSEKRISLTKKYIKEHYNLNVNNIEIIPKIIVVHWTGIDSFKKSFNRFVHETLPNDRGDIATASSLNVSIHYLIDRDGNIYQLMPSNIMARHVIGLNFNSIGIENVGGENGVSNLTKKQLVSNIKLIKKLQHKYKTIKHIIGHYEYRNFEESPLWLEIDENYRTEKSDPSLEFMEKLREKIST